MSPAGLEPREMLSPEAVADPYAFFAALREEDPVHWNEGQRAWVISRYDDVAAAFLDRRFSSDRVQAVYDSKLSQAERESRAPTFELLADWMVFKDPPDHTRLRDLVKRTFTPRAIERLRPRVEAIVDEMLDLPASGEIDVIHEIAYPLPALVIAEMLGVPTAERDRFRAWSNDISSTIFQASRDEADRRRSQAGLIGLSDFLRDLVHRYQREPGENLISELVAAREGGTALSEREIVSTCVLLLFGGHETTTNLIANGYLALLRNPEQAELVRGGPEAAAAAVEELNRFDGPAKISVRRAGEDIELRGKTIPAGSKVLLAQAGANRDPRRFENPEEVDIEREENRNVAFGFGIHYCLGAPLARLEVATVLPRMLERLPNAEVAGDLSYQPMLLTRSLGGLPVRYG
jgi:cytochrome P450